MTATARTALAIVGAVLVLASVYVERHRVHYDRGMQTLSAFAGGVAATALAAVG